MSGFRIPTVAWSYRCRLKSLSSEGVKYFRFKMFIQFLFRPDSNLRLHWEPHWRRSVLGLQNGRWQIQLIFSVKMNVSSLSQMTQVRTCKSLLNLSYVILVQLKETFIRWPTFILNLPHFLGFIWNRIWATIPLRAKRVWRKQITFCFILSVENGYLE